MVVETTWPGDAVARMAVAGPGDAVAGDGEGRDGGGGGGVVNGAGGGCGRDSDGRDGDGGMTKGWWPWQSVSGRGQKAVGTAKRQWAHN